MDVRLSALASECRGRYSRYADDLAFSGDSELARGAARLLPRIAAIIADEGFRPNLRKTRVLRSSARQRLVGLTINARPNVARHERDRLEAILTNCVRHGPATQNRANHPDFRAHLEGRVAWVGSVNPRHEARLRALLDAVDWSC